MTTNIIIEEKIASRSALASTGQIKKVLTKIQTLIDELNKNGLRYCHWKSNRALAESLLGQTDIDLLIHREDARYFRAILSQLCFRPAVSKVGESFPSMEHYYSIDEESGVLIHVHAYYRVITGESLSKNYRFPVEEMLLQNTRQEESVRVPTKGAELVVFTLRMMLKHTSLVELVLIARYWKQVKQEIKWLLENDSLDEALSMIECWLPSLDTGLFSECVDALASPAPLIRRMILGRQLRSRLRNYARHSAVRAWLIGVGKFTTMFFRRWVGSQKGMNPASGGAVIAFVGPEATGKSTLLAEMRHWLGEHFAVEQIHAGKPQSTLLSVVPNLIVPTLRVVLPSYRSSHLEAQEVSGAQPGKSDAAYPLIFALRCVLLAHDRRALLTRAFGRAANGTIVLCDRYPLLSNGIPDGPQLLKLLDGPDRKSIRYRLARIEKRLYQEIPPPDLVIALSVPLDVAILRNATRGKKEPEDYVRMRHAKSSILEYEKASVYKVNTNQPFENTVLEVKKAIWNIL